MDKEVGVLTLLSSLSLSFVSYPKPWEADATFKPQMNITGETARKQDVFPLLLDLCLHYKYKTQKEKKGSSVL